jgi:ribosomal protein L37AE/L43A
MARFHSTARTRRPAAAPRIRPLAPRARHRSDCALCGSDDVLSDEALDGGLWLLGECGRCGHRWTAGPFAGPTPAPAQVRPVPSATEQAGIVAA